MKIVVIGIGYVGTSLAVLLSREHDVVAVDVVREKVEMLSRLQSPVHDEDIEKYLAEHEDGEFSLKVTTDGARACASAEARACSAARACFVAIISSLAASSAAARSWAERFIEMTTPETPAAITATHIATMATTFAFISDHLSFSSLMSL